MNPPVNTSILAIGLAAALAHVPADDIDTQRLMQLATENLAKIQTSLNQTLGEDGAVTESPDRKQPRRGLQMGSLAAIKLQPSSKLELVSDVGCASGLTPIEEWRRMFPRKD